MTHPHDPYNENLRIDDTIMGYHIENVLPLEEIDGVSYRLRHTKSGAQHIHISTQDKENTFGVTFKTVPTDSTGVAHILEHTVLCGSRRYPVRDPFFSMLKRSLNTFMNAFTASDWTMYPFSTQNAKDFYNLMDVYLDAAFFPKLNETSFKQEGHRIEVVTDPEGRREPAYMGVVYNEMKGAMSSADQVLARSLLNALYPDTTYQYNSGGEPDKIIDLTHAQLKAFHQHYYHPSNAFFYTYGNLPLAKHLSFISEKVLAHFDAMAPGTVVPSQGRWSQPQKKRYTYALAPEENVSRKCQVCLAWLTCGIEDTFEVLVLTVLEQILIGNAASPLRKALINSGLGSALSDGSGFDADNRDTMFACGLKEVDEDSELAIEKIIMDVLQDLAAHGLDREMIDSAIHQIEFHRKEITNTPYPYGIKLLLRMIGTWLHGGQAERILRLDNDFARLRKEISTDGFLEGRIKQFFLDNDHRILLTLAPDQTKAKIQEEQTRRRLLDQWEKMTETEKAKVDQEAAELRALQEAPEDVDCLPTLALSDIPPEVSRHATGIAADEMPLWCFDQPTSGIFYFNGVAGSSAVSRKLQPLVPFFCYAFAKIGTKSHDYLQMAKRIEAATGGLGLGAQARVLNRRAGTCLPLVSLSAKCLNRNLSPMVGIIEELISEVDFSNLERLKQLFHEYRSLLEAAVVQNGHRLAISLSSRAIGPANGLNEIWNGIHQVRMLRSLNKDMNDNRIETLASNLTDIARAVFNPQNVILSAIGESQAIDSAKRELINSARIAEFGRNQKGIDFKLFDFQNDDTPPFEGWSTSTAVSFVAQTIPSACLGHEDAPVLAVLSKLLRSLYLHREIREKGGAYGGMAINNPENCYFSLASYRDPHIVRTLKIFDGVADFIHTGTFDAEDIKEAIFQVCAEIDKPDPPGPSARKDFFRLILGITREDRGAYKQGVLKTTKDQVIEVTQRYFQSPHTTPGVAVISGMEQLTKANAEMMDNVLIIKSI